MRRHQRDRLQCSTQLGFARCCTYLNSQTTNASLYLGDACQSDKEIFTDHILAFAGFSTNRALSTVLVQYARSHRLIMGRMLYYCSLCLTLTALVLLSLQFSSVVMGFVGSEQGHRQFWIVTSMQNMSSINGTKHADIYSELQQTDNLFGNPSAIISDPTMTARS
ncbi:hypothetical protein EDB82DRAFT_212375 [Fusarium venenatum]|uniref:uncharacterized protein n=1 Tax=Fusarium venenatum TaxID=56646 RepID=UPI001D8FD940|nr:hypothetical protein EDB82DRAFT_212375 [Fusarium venenatum]